MDKSDINHIIKNFSNVPSKQDYDTISNWYNYALNNGSHGTDPEHMMCVYIFLTAANLRKWYYPISKDQYRKNVKELTDLIEQADPMTRSIRKVYMDYGTK